MELGEAMMSKGTIIYLGGFELPDKNAAAHRVLSNGKILRELGYNVVYIDVDKSLDFDVAVLGTKKFVQGFECWSLPYPKSKKEWFQYLGSIDSFKKVSEQYTDVKIVIVYNYQAMALMKLKKECQDNNMKIISDCTEWYSTKGTNLTFKIIKGVDSFMRMRVIQKRLDGIIVISNFLENYYSKCKNVIKIPPLVDLTEEKWNKLGLEKHNGKINLVYSGSPGINKDMMNCLIEILFKSKDISNYKLNIIGLSKKQYIDGYKNHEQLLDCLGNKIQFHGRLTHNESIQFLKKSDFSIFIREKSRLTKAGFPTKYVESISCGIPVITTNNGDLNDYIIEGENGFFIDGNSTERTKKVLEELLNYNQESIKEMKTKCDSSKIFHYENFIQIVEKFIKKTIDEY